MKRYLLIVLVALILIGQSVFYIKHDLIIAGEDDLIDVHNTEPVKIEA